MSIDADLSAMIAHVDVQIPFPIGTVWDLLTDLPRMARRIINSNPAAATILIEQRRHMLESDMRVTLQRASSLLGDAAFPTHVSSGPYVSSRTHETAGALPSGTGVRGGKRRFNQQEAGQ